MGHVNRKPLYLVFCCRLPHLPAQPRPFACGKLPKGRISTGLGPRNLPQNLCKMTYPASRKFRFAGQMPPPGSPSQFQPSPAGRGLQAAEAVQFRCAVVGIVEEWVYLRAGRAYGPAGPDVRESGQRRGQRVRFRARTKRQDDGCRPAPVAPAGPAPSANEISSSGSLLSKLTGRVNSAQMSAQEKFLNAIKLTSAAVQ